MPRTLHQVCAAPGCREQSFAEYRNQQEARAIRTREWRCFRHSKPNEVLSADNTETTTVLTLHPSYSTSRYSDEPPRLIGYFWGPEGTDKGHSGIETGPGFRAIAKDFPPGTRLVVTARIELPQAEESA